VTRPILSLALLLTLGCGGAQAAPTRAGEYAGPNQLEFLVTAPVQRQMPPERHNGVARVTGDDGQVVTLELEMFEGGDTCAVTATRAAPSGERETLTVNAGHECSSRFAYEGSPVAATVLIEQGTVRFGPGTLEVELSGEFVAEVASASGTSEVEGIARWQLDARRRGGTR